MKDKPTYGPVEGVAFVGITLTLLAMAVWYMAHYSHVKGPIDY